MSHLSQKYKVEITLAFPSVMLIRQRYANALTSI